jgi:hypothetical protein
MRRTMTTVPVVTTATKIFPKRNERDDEKKKNEKREENDGKPRKSKNKKQLQLPSEY